jgi:hypothetical protein
MGWKNVKEHYRIGHTVQVTDKGICIGSDYIHDIIVVTPEGKVVKRYDGGGNEDLARYQREINSDPRVLQRLAETPDVFSASITVYTYGDGQVIEKQCETPGWPNVTHDGLMMYDNTFSTDKESVVDWAKEEAAAHLRYAEENVRNSEKQLAKSLEIRAKALADLKKLGTDYPTK